VNLPIEASVATLCAKKCNFNLIRFKDKTHDKSAPPHFWVSISVNNDQRILLSIVTTQMSKLEQRYMADDEEKALESLVPLSGSDMKAITKPCVINCNETVLLSLQQLLERIDPTYCNPKSKTPFEFTHYDEDFNSELKAKIIHAIYSSPYVIPEVIACIAELSI
jgi:hypothetical protein